MSIYYLLTTCAFLLSLACGSLTIPRVIAFCTRKHIYDHPDLRKIHHNDTPRLGGITFLPSMLLSAVVMLAIPLLSKSVYQLQLEIWMVMFLISISMIYITGIVDDFVGLGALSKFSVQIIAASLLPISGLYIDNLHGLFGIYALPFWLGAPLTVFFLVFVDNALNLIDGIDGLCASLSIMALMGFFLVFLKAESWIFSILCASIIGVLVAFLYFNVLGTSERGNKIFMGDSGSLTLGALLGMMVLRFAFKEEPIPQFPEEQRLMVSLSFILIPLLDAARVAIQRICTGKAPFKADKNHIHHILMQQGLNQRQTLCCILALAAMFILLHLSLSPKVSATWIVIIDIILYATLHLFLYYRIRQKRS